MHTNGRTIAKSQMLQMPKSNHHNFLSLAIVLDIRNTAVALLIFSNSARMYVIGRTKLSAELDFVQFGYQLLVTKGKTYC